MISKTVCLPEKTEYQDLFLPLSAQWCSFSGLASWASQFHIQYLGRAEFVTLFDVKLRLKIYICLAES